MVGGLLVMGGLGVLCGVGLALASKIFYVYMDPRIEAVTEALPGANCGGCGLPGCSANAVAIIEGRNPPSSCVAGGQDVAAEIAQILGVKVELREPSFARLGCSYGFQEADVKYLYDGVNDCRAAAMLSGGVKVCPIGCVGLGTCVRACPFDALSMGPDNLPVVNLDRCTGCGTCARVCPKDIITLSSASSRSIGEYVTDECTAPCQRTCPTGINIPGYIREIRNGNYEEALSIIKEKCALPLVCGYICPAPCELACRRNLVDEGVAINPLKRFVADYGMKTGKSIRPFQNPDTGRRIAVIGGGVEGLTVSNYLARLGHRLTIFEAKGELGGILRYVIAEDRLPREVLDYDIKGVLDMGVEAKTEHVMGRDFTMEGLLKEGYDAVVVTTGGFDSHKIMRPEHRGPDTPVKGVFTLLDFLMAPVLGEGLKAGRHTAVIYSGINALEIARKCRESGAEKVTFIFDGPDGALPDDLRDGERLKEDGIEVRHSTVVSAISGSTDGLRKVFLENIDPEGKEFGEKAPMDVDTLLLSGGRLPEMVFVASGNGTDVSAEDLKWETIRTFGTFPGIGGRGILNPPEPGRVSDSRAVIKAILSGRRLARAINQHFDEGDITPIKNLAVEADYVLDVTAVHDVGSSVRMRPSLSATGQRDATEPVLTQGPPGLDETSARREAERCLQCGLICYKKG